MRATNGLTDCCVTGEIDEQALRRFQSSHRSPAQPFKPVQVDLFDLGRKLLPAGEKE